MAEIRNRITGEGQEDPEQLLPNPLNFRRHPKQQVSALGGVLDEIGWIQRVIVNQTTGHLLDGHARVELAIKRKEKTIPVLYVSLTEEEEKLALATFDPIGAMATTDASILDLLLPSITTDNAAIQAVLDSLGMPSNKDSLYTRKIEPPIYEPKGDNFKPSELYSSKKTKALLKEIEAVEMPEDVREFLRQASHRHTVFDYAKIAEFYAHAPDDIKALMEKSALVIIDFEQAIENGFVKLSKRMRELVNAEQGNA